MRLLDERQSTHGSFETNAFVSQSLKSAIRQGELNATWVQREALDLICTKLSRIASGQADFTDHWLDIIGYAHLVLRDINSRNAPPVERRASPGVSEDLSGLQSQA